MARRDKADDGNRRKDPPRRRTPGTGSLLLFWPFHLFALVTRPLRQPLRFFARLAGFPAVAALYALVLLAIPYSLRARQYDLGKVHAMPERSIVYDRSGVEIGRIHGEKRSIVPLRQVSGHFRKAILAREDERFYRHGAIDPLGIVRAAIRNYQGKREGASTITQQLVSDVFQLKRGEKRGDLPRQLDRKLLEIAIAIRLEGAMKKDDILEAYINQINWGRQIKGIGEASRIYFEKHPEELSLSQSALLAGIVRGPDSFNPFRSIDAAMRERDTTLERMVTAGVITRAEADAAKTETVTVRPEARRIARESYAMEAIRRDLEIILEKEDIELGGLDIITTIDSRIQDKAQQALEDRLRSLERSPGYRHPTRAAWLARDEASRGTPDYVQGAAVVLENRTGGVVAVVGGRDAGESPFNRATDAKRQIGSIFKPFVFLAAFDSGLDPDSPVSDGPLNPGEIKGAGTWRPRNSDGTFGGIHPASYGLVRSRNTMSVRVGNHAGLQKVGKVAASVGFTTKMPLNPSSFLGSWEASPWEVVTAYSIFPNGGQRCRPFLISQIKDRDGNVLYKTLPLSTEAASEDSSTAVSRILKEVAERGTAASMRRIGFERPCGGKTGTTNAFRDAWFTGYTSSLTCAVWVGFDTPRTTVHRGYGSTLSLPVWVEIMKAADRLGYKAGLLHGRKQLLSIELCHLSGKRATSGCREEGSARTEEVAADIAPAQDDLCPIHPARAMAVNEQGEEAVLKAVAVEDVEDIPLRAIPVEEAEDSAPRALPVEE
jgi:membrane peptidoglycan carboxypeptidase